MTCLGIIGGTGLEAFAELSPQLTVSVATSWAAQPVPLIRSKVADTELVFLSRHGSDHRIAPHRVNYRANIAALKQAGVDAIIAVNAVGGVDPDMRPGDLVIPHQLIDYTWGRASSFFDGEAGALQHIDFTHPYTESLRQLLIDQATDSRLVVHSQGVYGNCQGPRLETAAEIQRLARDGCSIVGMTGMPEACLARELDIPYASLALVVNPAAGVSDTLISMAEIERVLRQSMTQVKTLLLSVARQFTSELAAELSSKTS